MGLEHRRNRRRVRGHHTKGNHIDRSAFAAKVGIDWNTLAALIADVLQMLAACGLMAADAPRLARRAQRPVLGIGLRLRLEAITEKHVSGARAAVVTDNLIDAGADLTPADASTLCQQP